MTHRKGPRDLAAFRFTQAEASEVVESGVVFLMRSLHASVWFLQRTYTATA
jgi:hypothetical protein